MLTYKKRTKHFKIIMEKRALIERVVYTDNTHIIWEIIVVGIVVYRKKATHFSAARIGLNHL